MTSRAVVSVARMMRPPLGLLTGVGAAASLAISAPQPESSRLVLIAASVFLVTSGGYLINDAFDVERDRITHPDRPLPSGRVRWNTALASAVICLAAGLLLSIPLGSAAALLVASNVALLVAYSPLKAWNGILGNILTAYLCSSIALLGALTGGSIQGLLPAIVFVFLINLARETLLDVNDAEGDRAAGLRTAALVFGSRPLFTFSWIVVAFLALFSAVLAALGRVERPLLFFALTLGALGLFSAGLRIYQKGRDAKSFHSFKMLGRLCFFVSIPGFLAAALPLAAQAAPGASSQEAGISLPRGVLAYALAGIGLTFFIFANWLISDYNRESQDAWTRIDPRWRFYALFTALNYVFFFQCVTFALGVLPGLGQSWWVVALFVNGFIPFPVIWLELVYSKTSLDLGFTRFYEQNCLEDEKLGPKVVRYHDAQEDFRRKEKTRPWERLWLLCRFLAAWLLVYLRTPLLGFQLRQNWRNLEGAEPRRRYLQAAQDLLVIITNWLFVVGLAAGFTGIVWPAFAAEVLQPLAPPALVVFLLVLILSVLLGIAAFLQAPERELTFPNIIPFLLLGLYFITLWYDFARSGLVGELVGTRLMEFVEKPGGGATPWVLLGLLLYLIWNFLRQLKDARKLVRQSAQFADWALHNFGNLLTSPYLALQQVEHEIRSAEALSRLAGESNRQALVRSQIKNALKSLKDARELLIELKTHARRSWQEQWYRLSDHLERLRSPETGADGRSAEVVVEPCPSGIMILVDRRAFDDVLRNLIENARHAIEEKSPPHGEIRIAAHFGRDRFYPLALSISDNGTGIHPEVRKRMYSIRFTTKREGSGVGLFIVREFMQRVQGDIEVKSEVGENSFTTFILKFPGERVRGPRVGR